MYATRNHARCLRGVALDLIDVGRSDKATGTMPAHLALHEMANVYQYLQYSAIFKFEHTAPGALPKRSKGNENTRREALGEARFGVAIVASPKLR